jgi:hypothetical protein
MGMLVAVNALWDPPVVPFGALHLMAYTHLALLGFMLQTLMGAVSHFLPVTLAMSRTKSNKRRGPYLVELTTIIERWRAVQVGALSLGTMGLALVSALVWQFALTSVTVQAATWLSAGLVLLSLGLFTVKILHLFVRQPDQSHH